MLCLGFPLHVCLCNALHFKYHILTLITTFVYLQGSMLDYTDPPIGLANLSLILILFNTGYI